MELSVSRIVGLASDAQHRATGPVNSRFDQVEGSLFMARIMGSSRREMDAFFAIIFPVNVALPRAVFRPILRVTRGSHPRWDASGNGVFDGRLCFFGELPLRMIEVHLWFFYFFYYY